MQKNINTRDVGNVLHTTIVVFSADQILKHFLFAKIELMNGSWLQGLIRFTDHKNFGISFNLPVPFFIIFIVTIAALAWSVYQLKNQKLQKHAWNPFLLGLFIGGILGNLADRVILGYVRDWLLLWGRSAVNLADGAILIGLIGYLWDKEDS